MATSGKKRRVNISEENEQNSPVSKEHEDSESSSEEENEEDFQSDDDSDHPEINEVIIGLIANKLRSSVV